MGIDPWSGDLGMLLFRDDWETKLTPGELIDGRSTSYWQFMLNVKGWMDDGKFGRKHVVPMVGTSIVGARYLFATELTPDWIFVDSAHEKDETYTEITLFWHALAPGGVLFGDDYTWVSVRTDVDRFAKVNGIKLEMLKDAGGSLIWAMQKPKETTK